MKEVDILVGIPCCGKSTYCNTNYKDEIFIISRDNVKDDILKKYDFDYQDFFEKPKDGEKIHPKYGVVLESGEWSRIKFINDELIKDFDASIRTAMTKLEQGIKVVVDMKNITKKERNEIKEWFSDIENVKFNAVIFECNENLDLIRSQNRKRGAGENKFIPDYIIEKMSEIYEPVDLDEHFDYISFVDGLKNLKKEYKLHQEIEKKEVKKIKRKL